MKPIYLLPHFLRQKRIEYIVRPFTLVGKERIKSLYNLSLRIEEECIPGDVVECGVMNGGTAAILAHFATHSKLNRTVWLFDSFEGMPETTDADGDAAKQYVGKGAADVDQVYKVLSAVGAGIDRVRVVKGWFRDTFPLVDIPKIAFLNIDSDWYESVSLCLQTFYEHVVPGGVISIDDYGFWPGCKKALDEFFKKNHLSFPLHRVDASAHWFQKI